MLDVYNIIYRNEKINGFSTPTIKHTRNVAAFFNDHAIVYWRVSGVGHGCIKVHNFIFYYVFQKFLKAVICEV